MTSLDLNDLKRYQVPTSMSVKTVIIIMGLYSIWSCEILLNVQLESTLQTDKMFLKQCNVYQVIHSLVNVSGNTALQ